MRYRLLTAVALLTLLATSALADILFEASLTGDQLVPPSGSGAGGVASIILSEDMTTATYTINFAGLEGGAQIAAHFHEAPAGMNGAVVFPLALGSPLAGVWALTPSDAAALIAEEIYVNIHTDDFPAGEIRGQFIETAVSSEAGTWSQVKGLFR